MRLFSAIRSWFTRTPVAPEAPPAVAPAADPAPTPAPPPRPPVKRHPIELPFPPDAPANIERTEANPSTRRV